MLTYSVMLSDTHSAAVALGNRTRSLDGYEGPFNCRIEAERVANRMNRSADKHQNAFVKAN